LYEIILFFVKKSRISQLFSEISRVVSEVSKPDDRRRANFHFS